MEINKYFDIHFERADDATIAKRLIGGAKIKGPALVILILSMFIASIGLNMNSTAVIIGAMLISPLMGPILATGFGFATLNFTVVKSAILRLSLQITIAVLASALYFYISPVQTATSELLARTEPNIFDVFIAIFGGLAGIIGQTRKTLDNVIPGVAIATALMPPLCTAGYGLASGNWTYFFGASYLFFINAFFIFFAAFIVLTTVLETRPHERAQQPRHAVPFMARSRACPCAERGPGPRRPTPRNPSNGRSPASSCARACPSRPSFCATASWCPRHSHQNRDHPRGQARRPLAVRPALGDCGRTGTGRCHRARDGQEHQSRHRAKGQAAVRRGTTSGIRCPPASGPCLPHR